VSRIANASIDVIRRRREGKYFPWINWQFSDEP
jgi:hypothetical protein